MKIVFNLLKAKIESHVDYLLSKYEKLYRFNYSQRRKKFVKKVLKKSAVSIIGHYEGLCHVFVDRDADLSMAIKVVKNSKMRNVSICGAAETLLIDKMCMKNHCKPILNQLSKLGMQNHRR